MTMYEFQKLCNESSKTIQKWLEQGYIPGAIYHAETDQWEIPSHARPPYTKARAKTTQSIYASIVDALNKRRHVFPALYHLDPSEFEGYIDVLVKAGLISRRTVEGITYYDATLQGQEYAAQSKDKLRKLIAEILPMTVESIANGCTAAMLEASFEKAG